MNGLPVDYPLWVASLGSEAFDTLADAAEMLLSIHEALANDGLSILQELLREQGGQPIEAWAHYPPDDCLDAKSGAMFYYHAHDPADWALQEHGHFHLFIRPAPEAKFSHLGAISMTAHGLPTSLFATNRWVTDERMLPARELLGLLESRWEIARTRPSWMVSQWLNALLKLLRPYLEALLQARDHVVGMSDSVPSSDGRIQPDDRSTHILSEIRFDLMELLSVIQRVLRSRAGPDSPATAASHLAPPNASTS